jgi:hypothetical protein
MKLPQLKEGARYGRRNWGRKAPGRAESRPMEMTAWDRALLHALYSTPQRNKMQLSEMQTVAFKDITAKAQN